MPTTSANPPPKAQRAAIAASGLLGALAVHAVLVLPFILELSSTARKMPDRSGAGASALLSAAEPEMTAVFINDSAQPSDAPPPELEPLASRGSGALGLQVVVLSPNASAAGEAVPDESRAPPDSSATVDDPAPRAQLYGRYVGQVQARIERAWMRPRTAIGAPTFSCRARIQQNHRGDVINVSFYHCNGTERWQQSLLSGIRSAVPLPAPPDASVYADVLWLSFSSYAFEEAGSSQGFEPEVRTASTVDPSVLESFQQFVNGSARGQHVRDDAQVFHLTIIGTPSHLASVPSESRVEPPPLPPGPPSADPPPQ